MMLINYTLQLKSSGLSHSRLPLRRQAATALSKFQTHYQKSVSSGFLHSAIKVYKQNPLLATVVGGFSVVSLIFVVLIFALASGNSNSLYGHYDGFSDADETLFGGQYTQSRIKYDLNRIALSLIEGDDWNKQNIDFFASGWKALDALEKAEVKQTVWFQSLENTLLNSSLSGGKDKRGKMLADLTAQLGLHRTAREPSIAKHNKPSAKNLPAVAKAETSQAQANKTQVAMNTPATTQAAKPELQKSQPAESTLASNNREQSHEQLAASTDESTVTGQSMRQPQAVANIVSEPSTSRVANAQNNAPSFTELSAKTVQKKRVNRVIRTSQPVEAQQVASAGQAKVASAQPSLAKQTNSPANENQAAPKGNTISESDLQKITTEFVSSYENGNIISFTSLFAPKAVSNDDADLDTIKKEYASLFATTSDRRMIIDGIKWDLSNNTATGEGQLEVAVKSRGAKNPQVYSGKIQIVVEKQVDGVQITKLYHALQ